MASWLLRESGSQLPGSTEHFECGVHRAVTLIARAPYVALNGNTFMASRSESTTDVAQYIRPPAPQGVAGVTASRRHGEHVQTIHEPVQV